MVQHGTSTGTSVYSGYSTRVQGTLYNVCTSSALHANEYECDCAYHRIVELEEGSILT